MTDSRLEEFRKTTREQFQVLCAEFPELKARGLTLFLGRYYAYPGSHVFMLGLNPGLDKVLPEDYSLQPVNCLLGDPGGEKAREIRYWRSARKCFGDSPDLEKQMETATFSFCSPFRTPSWNVSARLWKALERYSRPVLRRIFQDCRPRFVVVAGKTAGELCARLIPITVDERVV